MRRLLLLFTLVIAFAGCNKQDVEPADESGLLVGTWVAAAMTVNSQAYDLKQTPDMYKTVNVARTGKANRVNVRTTYPLYGKVWTHDIDVDVSRQDPQTVNLNIDSKTGFGGMGTSGGKSILTLGFQHSDGTRIYVQALPK